MVFNNSAMHNSKKINLLQSLSWEKLISIRYLASKNRDGFLSVIAGFSFLGICIGVATLIIVMSVMGGFREELLTRIIGMKGHALVYSHTSTIENNDLIKNRIKEIKGVNIVCPLIERQAIITANNQSRGSVIISMDNETILNREIISKNLIFQNNLSLKDFKDNTVIIGKKMAYLMGLNIGSIVTIMNPQGEITPFGTVPTQQDFKVIGTFEVGMTEYDKNIMIMPLKTTQDFFGLENKVTQIEIFTKNIEENDDIVDNISKLLKDQNMEVVGWKHGDSHFFNAIQIERNVMFLILTLIIIIASFNIISGLVMLVKDKTRDIAIMKTMGASRRSIMRIFLMTGSIIGVVGTLLGTIIGITVTMNLNSIVGAIQKLFQVQLFNPEVYFLATLPTKLNWNEVLLIAFISMTLSILATLYPSFRASRLDPIEALRSS